MKAGIIGLPSGDFDDIESVVKTETESGYELTDCIEVRQRGTSDSGHDVVIGRAASEQIDEEQQIEITDGSISVVERPEVKKRYTDFISVPGEFVVVSSGQGAFAFDLIGKQVNRYIERANINLEGFYNSLDDVSPWQVGFYGHQGNADTGVVYGDAVLDDSDFGGLLAGMEKNQIGLDYPRNGEMIKMTASQSGYVEIYQPGNYDALDFADYIIEDVLPYARVNE